MNDSTLITHYGILQFKEGILYVRLIEDLEITADILEHIHAKGIILSGGKPYCILADVSLNNSSTPEARAYGSFNSFMKNHLAYAMVGNSTSVNLLANFFIKFNKPRVTTRLFKREEEAVLWLKGFLPVEKK